MPRLSPDDPRLAAPDYPHGQVKGYVKGCSCAPCRGANATATAERKHRLTGRESVVLGSRIHSDRAKAHILKMLGYDDAIKPEHIGTAAGVGPDTIWRVLNGTKLQITEETESRVLAVDVATVYRVATKTMVPAGPVIAHIKALLKDEYGTIPAIAAATGLDNAAVWAIHNGERERVRRSTAKAITAVTPARLRRCAALVPAGPARARVRALQANGWTLGALNKWLGHNDRTNMTGWLNKESAVIQQATDRAIARMYEEIGDVWGGSADTAKRMQRRGFWPPICYDDRMRLIPDSIPGKRWEPITEPQDRARINLRIMGLTLREFTGAEVAAKVGYSAKKVERIRREIGLQLDANAVDSVLLDYIKPGQDALVAEIRRHVEPIDLNEALPMVDQRGLDYVALWNSLVVAAERLRAEVEAWEEYAVRQSWTQQPDLASVA